VDSRDGHEQRQSGRTKAFVRTGVNVLKLFMAVSYECS
jgi:hypothetical protein